MLVENLRSTIYVATPKWITGKITAKTGTLSYKVEIDGIIHRQHVEQMLPSKAQVVVAEENAEEDIFIPTPVYNNPIALEPVLEQTTHRNLPRNRSAPDYLTY